MSYPLAITLIVLVGFLSGFLAVIVTNRYMNKNMLQLRQEKNFMRAEFENAIKDKNSLVFLLIARIVSIKLGESVVLYYKGRFVDEESKKIYLQFATRPNKEAYQQASVHRDYINDVLAQIRESLRLEYALYAEIITPEIGEKIDGTRKETGKKKS